MKSLFPDICSDDLAASKEFYVALFDFVPAFEIDWYLQLQSPTDANLQLAFVKRDHHSVPAPYRQKPQGVVVTIELTEVEPVYRRARSLGLDIVLTLRDEVWGQRHFMTLDPNGLLVDVVEMIEPKAEFLQQYGLA